MEVEIENTGKINGPSQAPGGLSFGTTYMYYRLPSFKPGEWLKCGERSFIKIKGLIEHSLSSDLEELLK